MEEYNSLLLGDGDCTDRPCFLFLFPFLHPLASSIAKIVCHLLLMLMVRVLFILMTAAERVCSSEQKEQGPLGPRLL